MDVILRTDASLEIGTGHVMRCLTLAQALRAFGVCCHFASRLHTGHMIDAVGAAGFDVLALPESAVGKNFREFRLSKDTLKTELRSDIYKRVIN